MAKEYKVTCKSIFKNTDRKVIKTKFNKKLVKIICNMDSQLFKGA